MAGQPSCQSDPCIKMTHYLTCPFLHLHYRHDKDYMRVFKKIESTSIGVREPLYTSEVVDWLKPGRGVSKNDPDLKDDFETMVGSSAECTEDDGVKEISIS